MPLLERNVELYVSSQNTAQTDTRRLSLLSGYSFNQDVRLHNIERRGLSPTFSRGFRKTYVNNVIRADAEFTQYLTPAGVGDCAERPLWIGLLGNSNGISTAGNSCIINTTESNIKSLQEGTIWFKYPDRLFRLNNTVVEGANIDFGVNSFPTVSWNMTGTDYEDRFADPAPTAQNFTQNRCILGKLSTVTLNIGGEELDLAIIEGNLRISNGVRYLGRSRVGRVTSYPKHYTGTREIRGEITVYVHPSVAGLIGALLPFKGTLEQVMGNLTIKLGGDTTPNIEISLPKVMLNMPDTAYSQILTTTIRFTALESIVGAADELTVTYRT